MKFTIILSSLYFLFIAENSAFNIISTDVFSYLNPLQIIRAYGYPAEAYIVQTVDGYLLELQRIPCGKNNLSDPRRMPPVLMQHGLLGSSIDFLLNEPENGLPFILADLGFDVWLGNARGNTYSRAHVSLTPKDKAFWSYTWHESGIYDLPAEIDFILNHTKQEKLVYIGYSMGTTLFFVMTSMRPEYNQKVELSLLMAAVGYVENMKSPLLRLLTPFSKQILFVDELVENGAFFPGNKLMKILTKYFCDLTYIDKNLCMNIIYLMVGSDPKNFDQNLLDKLISHYPAGYSARGVNHYSQMIDSGKFQQYDYGTDGNEKRYGLPTPPDYPVENIKTPMYFYEGVNDLLSTLPDVNHLAQRLKSLKRISVMNDSQFSHLDFIISLDVRKILYDIMINDILSALNMTITN